LVGKRGIDQTGHRRAGVAFGRTGRNAGDARIVNLACGLRNQENIPMNLQEQIKQDLKAAMKAQDTEKTGALRVIMGEFGRMASKTLTDGEVVKILKKLHKSEKEVLARQNQAKASRFLEILDDYLPRMASEAEIEAWIGSHIDFTRYKNKMQAMGDIMRHFGEGADGNKVKAILQSRF
jgi:hypothetical protein